MKRTLQDELTSWKDQKNHKPLLLRGARQVGKTYIVRELGKKFENFVEINFEKMPECIPVFNKNLEPSRLIRDLNLILKQDITLEKTLLFFDEIQACPEAIIALRYFYEEMPSLHVIAAGSLLEFAIEKVGIPVGRVTTLNVYPLSFMEFLSASGNQKLKIEIENHELTTPLNEAVHEKLISLLGEYLAVGGMPEAVNEWINTGKYENCLTIHQDLIRNYKQDFEKYALKHQVKYVETVFEAIPRFLGKKIVYFSISEHYRARELHAALELLSKAGIAHIIYHSSGNGVPLGAEADHKKYKVILHDIALSQAILGLDSKNWILDPHSTIVNRGQIIEAFVGQELLAYGNSRISSSLHYWHREEKASQAEVDYLIAKDNHVVPIEVKSGESRKSKSLGIFMDVKKIKNGVQFSQMNYSEKNGINYLPLYAVLNCINVRDIYEE